MQRTRNIFVGRRQEMAYLTRALESAALGRGEIVLLAGSGGMGKTRLAQCIATLAERNRITVLWGRCLEEPGAPLYWPWRQLIRSYLRDIGDADPFLIFGSTLAEIAGIVPELAAQAGTPRLIADAGDSAPSRFRLFDAVAEFWRRAADRGPLLLIFEDLHRADATSLRLFAFIAAALEDSAMLVIGTYRDTELFGQHPLSKTLAELARSPVFHRIELAGLSERETEEFIAAASGGVASASFTRAIHARTEGHPLFLEETMRFILDACDFQSMAALGDDDPLLTKVPTGVREVIGERLSRLPAFTGRLLSIAACVGRTFDLNLLARLEAERSEEEILTSLEDALTAHLIEPVPQAQEFRFCHALIRETLYDELIGLRRSRLHLRIGELVELSRDASDPAVLTQLAYHFSEAPPEAAAAKALRYAKQAADHATELLAFEEAVRLLHLALVLQHRHFVSEVALRGALLLRLGDIESLLGAGELARAAFEEAAGLARIHKMGLLFAQAALGFEKANVQAARSGESAVALLLEALTLNTTDDRLRVELLAQLSRAYVYCNSAENAKEAHRRAVELARASGDSSGLYKALASICSALYWPELLHERLASASEARAIAEDLGLPRDFTFLGAYNLVDLIRVGDVPSANRLTTEALRLAKQSHSHGVEVMCLLAEGVVAINEGRFVDAEVSAAQALDIGRRVCEEQADSAYGMQMFCLRREQGRLQEVLPVLQQFVNSTPKARTWQPGLALIYAELDLRSECRAVFDSLPWDRASTAPSGAGTMTVLMFAAEVCVYLGDVARAGVLYPLLQPHAGANLLADVGGPCLGSADRTLGNLATVMNKWDVAERHFQAALVMDRQTGARVWLAHSRYGYAVMLHHRSRAGDSDQAVRLLGEALAESTALGMAALTPRITALVASIAASPRALPCGLTEREVGVLQLMAMGRNNREIGQVLAISPNTVANHVRSILEKTFTANRTEASAFANREGLLER